MKTKIFGVLCLFLLQTILYAQDPSIVNYLPLKIGNVWVYDWTSSNWPNNGRVRLKITNTVQSNGHTYYLFEQTGVPCSCAQPTYSPLLTQLNNPFRIDSTTGNIFMKSSDCGWHFGEQLFDSLKMSPNTTNYSNCFLVSCYDTNTIIIFGSVYPSRYVGDNIMTYGTFRRYVKGFGIVTSHQNGSYSSTCNYGLAGCVLNGTVFGDTNLVGVSPISQNIPDEFTLYQNYPNPFNPTTKIKFAVPLLRGVSEGRGVLVRLVVYDILGREVSTLINQQLKPGTYEVEWDASNYPSGVYFYQLSINNEQLANKKMVLVK